MHRCLCLALIGLVLASCNAPIDQAPAANPASLPSTLPHQAIEPAAPTRRAPPAASQAAPTKEKPNAISTLDLPASEPVPGPMADTYWVTNPASGARLFVRVFYPPGGAQMDTPTLLLVPGGTGTTEPDRARRLAEEGVIAITFDPDGRGRSEGTEDYDGFLQQDGLAAVAAASLSITGVNHDRFGLVSYSYGITMASGALARYPDLPLAFLIDWEGPSDRNYTTVGCKPEPRSDIQWQPCDDEAFWSEREAVNFIGSLRIPYQRIQSQSDHVQPMNAHAVDLVNAAVEGGVPWVRLNDYSSGQTYDPANPPAMFPDSMDRELEAKVAAYAVQILSMPGR